MPRWLVPIVILVLVAGTAAEEEKPWFVNVATEAGLAGVRAKDGIFTDLNGDGFYDLCLDRRRFYLSKGGASFVPHEEHGIAYPEVTRVPIGKTGKPDLEKAKKAEFVPQYLYFADVDNDGDQDALYGVRSVWEWYDRSRGRFITIPECDHEVRSQVWLNDGTGKFTLGPASRAV